MSIPFGAPRRGRRVRRSCTLSCGEPWEVGRHLPVHVGDCTTAIDSRSQRIRVSRRVARYPHGLEAQPRRRPSPKHPALPGLSPLLAGASPSDPSPEVYSDTTRGQASVFGSYIPGILACNLVTAGNKWVSVRWAAPSGETSRSFDYRLFTHPK